MDPNDKEDEEIRLRDKLALAIIPSIIDRFTAYYKNSSGKGNTGKGWVAVKNNEDILSDQFKTDAKIIAEMSYVIADEMRKSRLKSFT